MINRTSTTNNLNNTGIFLELACLEFIKNYEPFFIKETQVPFSLFYQDIKPMTGVIDFLCFSASSSYNTICFIIECKKADPALKDWIFFRRNENEADSVFFYRKKEKQTTDYISYNPIFEICDRGLQIVSSKATNSFNNSNKDPIYNASIQANMGLKSIILNKQYFKNIMNNSPLIFYIPIVITTANLHICNTDNIDIDITTGTANSDKVEYTESQWIEYSVPIPEYLQIRNVNRHSTIIVNSKFLKIFFNEIPKKLVEVYREIEAQEKYNIKT